MPDENAIDMGKLPRETDAALKLIWIDMIEITLRADIPIATLVMYSSLHSKLSEACRLQTSLTHLKGIAETICRVLNYYPQKPDDKEKEKGKNKEE